MSIFVQIHANPDSRLPLSFENFATIMANMPGMYFEMDGSFVWVDHQSAQPHQMDGMVYDRDDRIEYIEIKGPCSPQQWLTLCQALCAMPIDPSQSFSVIDTTLRVHRVAEGDWTKPSEIALGLAQHEAPPKKQRLI